MKTIYAIIGILLVSIMAGCSAPPTPPPAPDVPDSGDTQIANPASVYCEENGGTLQIVDEEGGQVGYCYLGGGRVCEEWKFFRKECPAAGCSGDCPVYEPPAPDFCPDGKIVGGDINECGCRGPPKCQAVACTEEAKVCPDGSAVGREGPNCEFAACPGE